MCDEFHFHNFGWEANYVHFAGLYNNEDEICAVLGD
jgi:hypothetical protein